MVSDDTLETAAGNRYLEGDMAPVVDEVTATDLPVTGTIPEELEGRWLRNGPNPLGDVDPSTHHWFMGDGMVHGVRLRGGRAEWYRNRWVRGPRVAAALGGTAPAGTSFGDRDFGPNTSVGGFAGRTWAMVEAGPTPMTLTYELDTIGFDGFDGTLPAAFTAHPKYDPATGELHAVCYAYPEAMDRVQHVVVGPDGRVSKVTDIAVEGMPMVHDMSLTGSSVLVYDLPVCLDMEMAMGGSPFPFSWNPDHAARVGVLPRAGTADDIVWCEAPQAYVFHPVNAYDAEDGTIVVDVCRYDTVFDRDRLGPVGDSIPTLARWIVDPVAGRVVETPLTDGAHEFPAHDPRVGTRRHRYAFTAAGLGLGPTARVDVETGETVLHDHGPGRFGAEPIVVPKEGSSLEGDAWIMVCVNDRAGGPADLVILDGADLGAPPVAVVHLPRRVPDGFHGSWVPDTTVAPVGTPV
jgi:carotenoid cleavage dioxygenase-like enzyme|tara:strand:- start:6814 stop:8202 length:1389 start_codon:yes stop_codon:yes gene_type:complete